MGKGQLIKGLTTFSSLSLPGMADSYRSQLPCCKNTQATLCQIPVRKCLGVTKAQRQSQRQRSHPELGPSGNSRSANQCQASSLQFHKPALPSQAIKDP